MGKLPGVGETTGAALTAMGIATVGDLRTRSLVELELRFGKFGRRLHELGQGIDDHPVVSERPAKSISSEITFEQDLPSKRSNPRSNAWRSKSGRPLVGASGSGGR